jgi:hypothetical protein
VPRSAEAAQLLDVQVDQLARDGALVPAHRRSRGNAGDGPARGDAARARRSGAAAEDPARSGASSSPGGSGQRRGRSCRSRMWPPPVAGRT